MANFCLTKQAVQRFKEALRNRELDPAKLQQMTSEERRQALTPYVGEDNAKQVNALFESKLLLKNQKAGMIAWAKKVAGITPEVKRDLVAKIERLDKALSEKELDTFLEDLVSTRLGITVSETEAKTIFDLSRKVEETKQKANKDGVFPSENDRLQYGMAKVALEKYVNDLKVKSRKTPFNPTKLITGAPGFLKSIVASLDNSFWGRQGIKTLADPTTSHIWFKNFLKSFGDIGKELVGIDAIDTIKADIFSRPNSLNGKYKAGNYGLEVFSEEAFPSSLPEKIPLFGRLFKASESAYNGAALRLRADLADRFINIGEKNGLNMSRKDDSIHLGHLTGSLTGRGRLGPFEQASGILNTWFFSVKFFMSNVETLTAPFDYGARKIGLAKFESKGQQVAKKEAALSSLRIIATYAVIFTVAKLINPDMVDEDPRSTNFGKLKIYGKWIDITGGMGVLVRIAFNTLIPTQHNGKWSLWKKTSSGKWIDLREGGFGSSDGWDTLIDGLVSNKLSPIGSIFRDMLKGQNYDGNPVTPETVANNILVPLTLQTLKERMNDPSEQHILETMILEGLGFSTYSTKQRKDEWLNSPTKKQQAFLDKVGEEKFKKANEEYNRIYELWYETAQRSKEYNKLSDEGKQKLNTKAKNDVQDKIFKKYNFKYKEPKKTQEQLKEEKIIKKLTP